MTQAVIEGGAFPGPVCPDCAEDLSVVFIHNDTGVRIDKVIKAAAPVHTERERPVLVLIAKRKLHLIAVSVNGRASDYAVKPVHGSALRHRFCQEFSDLPFLDLQLFFVGKTEIGASAAGPERGTGRFSLQRRSFNNAEQGAFRFSFSLFVDAGLHPLSGDRVFDNDGAFLRLHDPLIGKLHFADDSLDQVSFFQMCLLRNINLFH